MIVKASPSGDFTEGLVASEALDRWIRDDLIARVWSHDASVWSAARIEEVVNRLAWLDAPTSSMALLPQIGELATQARTDGITDIVLCGMGGSSLAPEVFAESLPTAAGFPSLIIMDSTHPDAVLAVAERNDLRTTWFIIASKSGGTTETMSFLRFFWERASNALADPGSHFIAITDPGTSLAELARERGFRASVLADPNIGGRFSALTAFGLVPAALIGVDIKALLRASEAGVTTCQQDPRTGENLGLNLGISLAVQALAGSDKIQILGSAPARTIGAWVEQLVAESTGKRGVGIIPVDGGPLLAGATVISIGSSPQEHDGISITFDDPHEIASVMFLLEFATAVIGEILGINPFDQPDVERAKQLAKEAMDGNATSNAPPPLGIESDDFDSAFSSAIGSHSWSYVSIQAYLAPTPERDEQLQRLRTAISNATGTPVTVGYGPRFLHSTGQIHKGGPGGALYLQIVDRPIDEVHIPDVGHTFNQLIRAQVDGDRSALRESGRQVLAIDIGEASTGMPRLAMELGNNR